VGRVLSLHPAAQPAQARRRPHDGDALHRGETECTCDGKVGDGLSEYLDQIVDGKPGGINPV
jgi:hypothetical protein